MSAGTGTSRANSQFEKHLRARGQSPRTIQRRLYTLNRIAATGDPLSLTRSEIEDWIDGLEVTPQSRRAYLGDLSAFYRWAVRRDLLTGDPTAGIDRPKEPRRRPRPLTTDELRRARATATPRTRLIITLGAYGGLRAIEVARLHANDIDWDTRTIRVHGKGDVEREVPMHPILADELHEVDGWVAGWKGHQVSSQAISTVVSIHFQRCGIAGSFHRCRHWFGTHLYRDGGKDLRVTQQLMGHASPNTTQVYTEIGSDEARQAIALLPAA